MKSHAKFEESNALAAISRALVANKDSERQCPSTARPGGQPQQAASPGTQSKKGNKRPRSLDGGLSTAEELKDGSKEKKRKEKRSKNTKLHSREGHVPTLAYLLAASSEEDLQDLCDRLASAVSEAASCILAGSSGESAAAAAAAAAAIEAVGQALGVAARLSAALAGSEVAGLAGQLEALQGGLQGLSGALQGTSGSDTTVPEPHRQLLLSATALELATSAAQLSATSAAQPPLCRDRSGPGEDGGNSGSGQAHANEAEESSFQQAFVSSVADCFAAELEALQEAPAPAPAAVVRRGILGQAQLYAPGYQQLVLGEASQLATR
ncbi:hypothetical protein N2152v2_003889 [Parachlorella kessleri]